MGKRIYYEKLKREERFTKEERLELMFDLINSFRVVRNPIETADFLQDLLTAKEIKNLSLNDKQSYHIAEDYINEASFKFFYQDSIKNKFLLLDQLGHDLFLALFQANNNYKKQFPSFWDKFNNLKLPDLNLIKKG